MRVWGITCLTIPHKQSVNISERLLKGTDGSENIDKCRFELSA